MTIESNETAQGKKKKQAPRFGLRTMLIVVSVACLLFACLTSPYGKYSTQQQLVQRIESSGGSVTYDIAPYPPPSVVGMTLGLERIPKITAVRIGDRQHFKVGNLKPLKKLRELQLVGQQYSDEDMKLVASFSCLKSLYLYDTFTTAKGISELADMGDLQTLHCSVQDLNDEIIETFNRFPKLRSLGITLRVQAAVDLELLDKVPTLADFTISSGSQLDEKSLHLISKVKSLEYLDLREADVSTRGIRHLAALPELRQVWIYSDDLEQTLEELGFHVTDQNPEYGTEMSR